MNAKSSMGVLAVCAAALGVIAVVVMTSTSSSRLTGAVTDYRMQFSSRTSSSRSANPKYMLYMLKISCDQQSVRATFTRPNEPTCSDLVNENQATLNRTNFPELCTQPGGSFVFPMSGFDKQLLLNSKKAALCEENHVGNSKYCSTLTVITRETPCSSSSSSSSSRSASSSSVHTDYLCCVSGQCILQTTPCPGQECSSTGTCGSSSRSSMPSSSSSRSASSNASQRGYCCQSDACLQGTNCSATLQQCLSQCGRSSSSRSSMSSSYSS